MTNNRSLEANIAAAKSAVHEMIKAWNHWKSAYNDETKTQFVGAYVAAFTSCKVYIENYLKHLYPNEKRVPMKILQDIRNIVTDIDTLEKVNERMLQKAIRDLDQLSRDAA